MSTEAYRAPNGVEVRPCPSAPRWGKHATDPVSGYTRCSAHGPECAALPPMMGPGPAGRTRTEYLRESEALALAPSAVTGVRAGVQKKLQDMLDRAEAEVLFDARRAGTDTEPILSSLWDAEPVPEPSILRLPDGTYLLRPGWVHLFHGKPYCGKTPLCYIAIAEVLKAGGVVLLVDYEMGKSGAKALLVEMGVTEGQVRGGLLYAYNPHKWVQARRDRLAAEVKAREPDLVVIDSLSRSMSKAELDQNDATDTDAWFHSLPTWAVDSWGSAVMVIDHTTRTDGPHPSGSIQKTAAPQFHVWVQNVKPFSRDHEDGCSLLMVQKDRSGQRTLSRPVAELRTVLGGSFVLREVDKATSAVSDDEVLIDLGAIPYPQQVRLDLHEALRLAGADGVTKMKLTDPSGEGDGGGAHAKVRREQLDWLEKNGQAVCRREPGTSRGQRWWAIEFFPGDPDE